MNKENCSPYSKCLYFSASALSRIMTKMAEEEFSRTGLTPSSALALLAVSREPGIHPAEVAKIMELTRSTITRLVDKLEAKGLLERKIEKKFVLLYPTGKMMQLIPQIERAWASLYKRYTFILGSELAERLTNDIYAAANTLEEV